MKTSALTYSLLLSLTSVVLAQSPSPGGRPNYFGNAAGGSNTEESTTTPTTEEPTTGKTHAGKHAAGVSTVTGIKGVLDLLSVATEKMRSKTSTTPKADALPMIEAARDSLKKLPKDGRYKGHRTKAIEKLESALMELKTGDRANKATGYLNEGVAEVYKCKGYAD